MGGLSRLPVDPRRTRAATKSFVPRCRSLLVIPNTIALGWAAFEDVPEVGVLVKRRAVQHLVQYIVLQMCVVFALGTVREVVHPRLFLQLRHAHDRFGEAASRRY